MIKNKVIIITFVSVSCVTALLLAVGNFAPSNIIELIIATVFFSLALY